MLQFLIVFHLVIFVSSNINTTSHQSHYYSTNIDSSYRFSLCRKLNEYGCNPTQIPSIMQQYINNGINDYILPTDPCLFEIINMSYIFSHVDAEILNSIPDNSYFVTVPCQILIQLQSFLSQRGATYLISDDYWFGDNGQCDTEHIDNNPYNITVCNYTATSNNTETLIKSNTTTDACYDDDRCFYPFVKTKYLDDVLRPFGQCHCQISCEFRFYGGDIKVLDSFNQGCIWISLILTIGYFINLFLELKYFKADGQKIMDLPLTFDIPFFCASALFAMTICALLPYLISKNHFTCETGTKAYIKQVNIPGANWSCFIQGSIIYIAFLTIYTYFMVLSVSVWRYLVAPMDPLFGIHKKYFHLVIWIYILGMYTVMVSKLDDKSMAANNIIGICGSTFFRPLSYVFNWYPSIITVIVFAIITPLTIYKLNKTMKYSRKHTVSEEDKFSKELVHLSIRLLLYTCFLCASCVCFLYIVGELLFHDDKWDKIASDYVMCLVFESYLMDSGLSADYDACILDPNNELPISIYFMQGTIVLLVSIASFVLSCSNSRYVQWKHVKAVFKIKYAKTKDKLKETSSPQMIKATSASVGSRESSDQQTAPHVVKIGNNSPITPDFSTKTNVVELTTI